MSSDSPIGVFDSGVGGLTVFNEIVSKLPHENIVYLADSAHFPYGEKSADQIFSFSLENAKFLLKKNVKLLFIACHSASAYSLEILRTKFSIPVISISEFGYESAIQQTKTDSIAILGTEATIHSRFIETKLKKLNPNLIIHPIACPLFAPLIEKGLHEHESIEKIANTYLKPLKNTSVDVVFLACTHYPLLTPILQKILGPDVTFIQPATFIASEIVKILQKTNQLNESNRSPIYQFFSTDHPFRFQKLAQLFLRSPKIQVNLAKK